MKKKHKSKDSFIREEILAASGIPRECTCAPGSARN